LGEILHKQLSFDLVGMAQKVHRVLGPGFPESVYRRALCYEIAKAQVPFETEKKIEVWYEDHLCGEFRTDLIVDGKLVLELKAVDALCDAHVSQVLTYLKATALHLGILLNFGTPSLETKRVVL
jgi:GxxExxY protein